MVFSAILTLLPLLTSVSASFILHETRPSAPAGFTSQGKAPADQNVTLRVGLKSSNMAGLEAKLLSISTPGSADFRKWLSAEELKPYMEPSQATLSAFTSFVKTHNLTHSVLSPHNDWMSLTLSVAQANTLFAADFRTFSHEKLDAPITRTLSVSLPRELADHVEVLHPTTAFLLPKGDSLNSRIARQPLRRAVPASCIDDFLVKPACLQELYGIPKTPATASAGGKNNLLVTGYEDMWANEEDLKNFLMIYRPDMDPNTKFELFTLDGGKNPQEPENAGPEANLDIQYTVGDHVGLATGVPVQYLSVGGALVDEDLFPGMLDTIFYVLGLKTAPTVITTSYGDNEENFGPSAATKMCDGYMAMAARGISNLFASGDGGPRGGHDHAWQCSNNTFIPVFPGTCPWITSVGSTQDFEPEIAAPYTSGGFSNFFPVPAYQSPFTGPFLNQLPGDFAGIFNRTGRGFPDLSLTGSAYATVVWNWTTGLGETSASAPAVASMISLINDRLLAAGKPVLGFLNPWLYGTAAKTAFTDITAGKNFGTCQKSVSFEATQGWDPITGLGTPSFDKLLAAAQV
ncbi:Family S53 protease-like protein [Mycena indigotica]|uniref:tripeptidyl-peptidase II n=1 Tax=Mycena indigotica TaxID=2126181 RepID=A0A8H6S116_9AGAR|nr:Family S53 protease-like protein [Mycena indigotica]KAF7290721.1 Family S53 protease-like protein [Mycena indigotica]